MVVVNTLVMVLAMIAPGFAARVLGMPAQSAVIVFAPAGLGMLLATGLAGRWGRHLRHMGFVYIGLVVAGLSFATLGYLSLDYQRLLRPILQVYPQMTFSLTSATMVLAFVIGLSLSTVNILAQTTVQENSPGYIRGRVFSVLFMLMALVGIPPMLALGEVADRVGIPNVMILLGVMVLILAGMNLLLRRYDGSFAAAWNDARLRVPIRSSRPVASTNGSSPEVEQVPDGVEEVSR
jgi:MFS family permease